MCHLREELGNVAGEVGQVEVSPQPDAKQGGRAYGYVRIS